MSKLGLYLNAIRLPADEVLTKPHPYLLALILGEGVRSPEIQVRIEPLELQGHLTEGLALELQAPADLGGFIVCRLAVLESERDLEQVVDRIDGARHLLALTQLGRIVEVGVTSPGAAVAALEEAGGLLVDMQKLAGDVVLFSETIRLEGETLEDRRETLAAREVEVAGLRADITLRLAADAAAAAKPEEPKVAGAPPKAPTVGEVAGDAVKPETPPAA